MASDTSCAAHSVVRWSAERERTGVGTAQGTTVMIGRQERRRCEEEGRYWAGTLRRCDWGGEVPVKCRRP
eukprot:1179603-Prorocentrum_minimum.AAC.1